MWGLTWWMLVSAPGCGDAGAPQEPDAAPDDAAAPGGDAGTGSDVGRELLVQAAALDVDTAHPIDARSRSAFEGGHIPGALWLDVDTLRVEVGGVPGQLPPTEDVAAALEAAGVGPDDALVVYAANSDLSAARLQWTLEYMGHASVALLDGGFEAWQAADKPVEAGPANVPTTDYPTDRVDERRRVDAAWVLARLDDPDTVLIDARSAGEFAAGHIPGARSFDWQGNVADGVLKPRAALRERYRDLPENATLVTYCQTGSRAAMAYFTLRYLGFADVRLYDGSMADWTSADRPVDAR